MSKKWKCDFCDQTEDEIAEIVHAPSDIAICSECVAACAEIIAAATKPSDGNLPPPPPPPRQQPRLIAGSRVITDRQVEIMTATVCDVIANCKFKPGHGDEAVGALISAMVQKISMLNSAVEAANSTGCSSASEDAGLIPLSVLEAQRRDDQVGLSIPPDLS